MQLNNPFSAADLDMQDIRGEQYALFNPAGTIMRLEGVAYLALACLRDGPPRNDAFFCLHASLH